MTETWHCVRAKGHLGDCAPFIDAESSCADGPEEEAPACLNDVIQVQGDPDYLGVDIRETAKISLWYLLVRTHDAVWADKGINIRDRCKVCSMLILLSTSVPVSDVVYKAGEME